MGEWRGKIHHMMCEKYLLNGRKTRSRFEVTDVTFYVKDNMNKYG